MKDVSPGLLKSIMDDFENDLDSSRKRKQLLKVIEEGTATYKEANEYAIEVGEILAKAFQRNLSSEVLPDGHMYYNIAQKVVAEPLKNNYKLVSKACADVQTALNKSAGLGLKGVIPDLNQDRIQGILNLISGKEQFDDIKYMLDEPVVNFTQSVVDDSIKKNAECQYQSGLSPKIRRISMGKCCKWCDRLVGTYDYATVRNTGNDVFRRHNRCRCTVEFITNGKKQNVHTKKWRKEKVNINSESELQYRTRYNKSVKNIYRNGEEIVTKKIKGSKNVFIAEDSILTKFDSSNACKAVEEAYKLIYGNNIEHKPDIYILSSSSFVGKTTGAYRWYDNNLFLNETIFKKENLKNFNDEYVFSKDARSHIIHELIHVQQHEETMKIFKRDVKTAKDFEEYDSLKESLSRNKVENLIEKGYSYKVSRYAEESFRDGVYTEVMAEMYTYISLKRRTL